MKNKICVMIAILILFVSFGNSIYATTGEVKKSTAKSMFIKFNYVGENTLDCLEYNNIRYVPLADLCSIFKCRLDVDESKKNVNITTYSYFNGNKFNHGLLLDYKPIEIELEPYNIQVEGIDAYMEPISYKNNLFVPFTYFAQIFDIKVEWTKDVNKPVLTQTPIKYIGTVDNIVITQSDLDFNYNLGLKNLKDNLVTSNIKLTDSDLQLLKQEAYDQLVNSQMILNKIKESDRVLTASDKAGINGYFKTLDIKRYRRDLATNNINFYQFINNVKLYYIQTNFITKTETGIQATEDAIKKYYEKNKTSFIQPAKLRVKQILILTVDITGKNISAENKSLAKQKSEDILGKIKAGESFDNLLKANALAPETGLENEVTFGKGVTVKAFEDAAFSLKVGEISKVFETPYGYHIIRLEEKIPGRQSTFEEAKTLVKLQADQVEKQNHWNALVKKWTAVCKVVKY